MHSRKSRYGAWQHDITILWALRCGLSYWLSHQLWQDTWFAESPLPHVSLHWRHIFLSSLSLDHNESLMISWVKMLFEKKKKWRDNIICEPVSLSHLQACNPLHCNSPTDIFHNCTKEPFPVRHGNGPGSSDSSHDLLQVNRRGCLVDHHFPGGPVSKTSCSQCRGPGSIPGQRTGSHMLQLRDLACCNEGWRSCLSKRPHTAKWVNKYLKKFFLKKRGVWKKSVSQALSTLTSPDEVGGFCSCLWEMISLVSDLTHISSPYWIFLALLAGPATQEGVVS